MSFEYRPTNWARLFGAAILMALPMACANESTGPEETNEPTVASSLSEPGAGPTELAMAGLSPVDGANPVDDDTADKAGCTYIQYCNYPNSWVGTRCIWSACSSFCSAVAECISDTRYVCGSPSPTWTILTSAGDVTMSSARAYCGL